MKKLILLIMPLIDLFLIPFTFISILVLRFVRMLGIQRLPISRSMFFKLKLYPLIDHYYEPSFNPDNITKPLTDDRFLPGINYNEQGQLSTLDSFNFTSELKDVMEGNALFDSLGVKGFKLGNMSFESGDAEFWYNMVRWKKPSKIIEVGSGNSTLLAAKAIEKNKEEDESYRCEHICIEPYEQPWLEKMNIVIIRKKIEDLDLDLFKTLNENDILFIDSSHIIRPQGDVLFEYLTVLPILKKGVIVHIHDIFTPKNYPENWLVNRVKFWNEQYLLEAFLTSNNDWKIIGALSYLFHNHYNLLKEKCPYLTKDRYPGSFYMKKVG